MLFRSIIDACEILKVESPDIKIGLSKFKQLRPPNSIPTTKCDQIVCACRYCENAELSLSALRQAGVCDISMPSTVHQLLKLTVCGMDIEACVKRECDKCGVDILNRLITEHLESMDWYQWRDGENGYLNKLCEISSSETVKTNLMEQLSFLSLHM